MYRFHKENLRLISTFKKYRSTGFFTAILRVVTTLYLHIFKFNSTTSNGARIHTFSTAIPLPTHSKISEPNICFWTPQGDLDLQNHNNSQLDFVVAGRCMVKKVYLRQVRPSQLLLPTYSHKRRSIGWYTLSDLIECSFSGMEVLPILLSI